MSQVTIQELLDAGVHFGHQTRRWNPKMKPFIFEARNGIHIINLDLTVRQLEKACEFLGEVAAKGGNVLVALSWPFPRRPGRRHPVPVFT